MRNGEGSAIPAATPVLAVWMISHLSGPLGTNVVEPEVEPGGIAIGPAHT